MEFSCCGKKFASLANLQRHKREVHKPKQYTCVQCEKRFTRKQNMKRHLKKCGLRYVTVKRIKRSADETTASKLPRMDEISDEFIAERTIDAISPSENSRMDLNQTSNVLPNECVAVKDVEFLLIDPKSFCSVHAPGNCIQRIVHIFVKSN